jgi:uncharacterized protein with HEPN domain
VSCSHIAWLLDIAAAVDAINGYLESGDLSEGIVYDACRVRLIEIGEAVKRLDADLLATEPCVPASAEGRRRHRLGSWPGPRTRPATVWSAATVPRRVRALASPGMRSDGSRDRR